MSTPNHRPWNNIRDDFNKRLDSAFAKLNRLWAEIGIGEEQRLDRSRTVFHHLHNLVDEMVAEEECLKHNIEKRIADFTVQVAQLCSELSLPEFEAPRQQTMLQHEKDLRSQMEALTKEKGERMRALKKLKEEDQELCDGLCMTPYYIPTGTVPSREQLRELERHLAGLKAEKEKRFSEFVESKKRIVAIFLEMDCNPDTEFEQDVMCEDDDSFLLSSENMLKLHDLLRQMETKHEALKHEIHHKWDRVLTLWDRLSIPQEERDTFSENRRGIYKLKVLEDLKSEISRCEKMKFDNIQRFVEGMRKELVSWWDKCFFSVHQRNQFKPFLDDNYTEELLELHDKEVACMKKYYDDHIEILKRVEKREKLFQEMIVFEKNAADPGRFFNDRGGKFLQEEKARKKLMKELPKVESEVREFILDWEKQNGRPFLVNGLRFIEYLENSWTDYQQQKEQEKEQRHKIKTKQMEDEILYGSKPTTPAKRRFGQTNTPTRTPKHRKLNDTTKTPASCSRIQHTTVFASPYGKAPLSASKAASASKMNPGSRQRRRSNRLARKVLGEKNMASNETVFSHTTVSSYAGGSIPSSGGNMSLASMESYQDFATGLNPTARPYCRSSILPPPSPGRKV